MEDVKGNSGSETPTTTLVFAVNGEKFELSNVDPSTTLLEFLRIQTRFKSVKLGCGEGLFIHLVVEFVSYWLNHLFFLFGFLLLLKFQSF